MSKQGHLTLANKIKKWDYDESVKKMKPLIRQWKRDTKEVLRELYIAREFLTGQKGQYKDPYAKNYLTHSWSGYCGELGMSYQTVNNWLRPFTPKELSKTGEDILMLEAPVKEDTTAERALRESRIEKFLSTGERPKNFTAEEEKEARRRLESAKFVERVEKYNDLSAAITKTDYFALAMKRSKEIVNFKLETREQVQAQINVFKYIETYLDIFDDPETKARAAFNLALMTRNRANELAEENFQLNESVSEEEAEYDS